MWLFSLFVFLCFVYLLVRGFDFRVCCYMCVGDSPFVRLRGSVFVFSCACACVFGPIPLVCVVSCVSVTALVCVYVVLSQNLLVCVCVCSVPNLQVVCVPAGP